MQWLRDVHLPALDTKFHSAIINGNEDAPDTIAVYPDSDPLYTDTPVTFVLNTDGDYVSD